jgi:DNA polymerase I-like protein with 3'-5' exonuclease and polymerase domains
MQNRWYNRYIRGSRPVLAKNNTITHEKGFPTDDRPDYLKSEGEPYTIALDTETTGLDWYDGDFAFVATISDYDRDYLYRLKPHPEVHTVDEATADFNKLRRDILNADRIIFHNAAFDIHVLVSEGVVSMEEILAKEIHDTDLLARCVLGAANGPFGLKHLATKLIDGDADAAETAMMEAMVSLGLIKKVGQREKPPGAYHTTWISYPDLVERYALQDTRYTYDLFHVLMEQASEDDLSIYELERQAQPIIIRMEHKGTKLDMENVGALQAKYQAIKDDAAEKLFALNGYEEINLNSNAQVAEFLIRRGVNLTQTTETGELRVDKWALEKFDDEAVEVLQTHRNASKFLSTYIAPMKDRATVYTSFWQIGARTGRMSSSRPNLQNIPVRSGPEMREVFVPRAGYVFLDADYSSIELRILAYYMGDPVFKDIVESGDPFFWIGEQVYGTADQSQWKVGRSSLKNGTYALTYGAGGPKLAATIGGGMTDQEGRDLAKKIKSALGPGYYQLNRTIRDTIESTGHVKTIGRRTQHVDRDRAYVGLNALIQGTAADVMKQGLVNAAAALEKFDAYPLLVIHDEILAECPAEHAEEALDALTAAMSNATDRFDLKVEGKVCVNSFAEGK